MKNQTKKYFLEKHTKSKILPTPLWVDIEKHFFYQECDGNFLYIFPKYWKVIDKYKCEYVGKCPYNGFNFYRSTERLENE